jgi:succinate dehydrogenase/fumarate reductase cytochrome b subunit
MSDHDRPVWRPGRISGFIVLAYVFVWATAIAILGSDRRAYSTVVRLSGNVVARVAFGIVIFASILHAIEGIGRLFPNSNPERWRALAWFLACALGIPAAAVLLWPFFEGRF